MHLIVIVHDIVDRGFVRVLVDHYDTMSARVDSIEASLWVEQQVIDLSRLSSPVQ